jgi:transcriptional regulator with XRE-family HTH domain
MNSLPPPDSADFPHALKTAREAKNLSYSELARAIGISVVMPSRYENPEHSLFSRPSKETWKKINSFFYATEKVEPQGDNGLGELTVDQLVAELKKRGATSVQLTFG